MRIVLTDALAPQHHRMDAAGSLTMLRERVGGDEHPVAVAMLSAATAAAAAGASPHGAAIRHLLAVRREPGHDRDAVTRLAVAVSAIGAAMARRCNAGGRRGAGIHPARRACMPRIHAEDRRDAVHDARLADGTAVVGAGWKAMRDRIRHDIEDMHRAHVARCIAMCPIPPSSAGPSAWPSAWTPVGAGCGQDAVVLAVSRGLPADGDAPRLASAFMDGLPAPAIHRSYLADPTDGRGTRFLHVVQSWPSGFPADGLVDRVLIAHLETKLWMIGIVPDLHRVVVVRHDDKRHRHLHAWIDRVRASDGRVWTMGAIERTVAVAGIASVVNAVHLRHAGDPDHDLPVFHLPAPGPSRSDGGRLHRVGMAAIGAMAAGRARCDLGRQDPWTDGTAPPAPARDQHRSPWHGGPRDQTPDQERALFGQARLGRAMEILGPAVAVPGGFWKFDDRAYAGWEVPTAHERTTRGGRAADPAHHRHWLWLDAEPRPTTIGEHLFRRLGIPG